MRNRRQNKEPEKNLCALKWDPQINVEWEDDFKTQVNLFFKYSNEQETQQLCNLQDFNIRCLCYL